MFTRLIALTSLGLLTSGMLIAGMEIGPMLGPVSMREAKVWLQTESPAEVRIRYSIEGANAGYLTDPVQTSAHDLYCATLTLSEVEPGKRYQYQIEIDGVPTGGSYSLETPDYFQGKRPPPDIRFAVAGGHYRQQDGYEPPYQTLGGGYDIFTTLLKEDPQFMIWAGPTAHLRASDWTSRSGYLKRYAYARATPELALLLESVPNYATWGSADYGPPRVGMDYTYKKTASESFSAFWPQPSPSREFGNVARFSRSDVDFFIIDVQSSRKDQPSSKQVAQILGDEQLEWLRSELIHSTATFKVIIAGAPVLNPASNPQNMIYAEREQKKMLQIFQDERISGLFFISGGKNYGELTRLVHANSYNLHDLTVGPVTARPETKAQELNYFRMPGTSTFERHFAIIDVTGPEENRRLTIRAINLEGKELWTHSVQSSQLELEEL